MHRPTAACTRLQAKIVWIIFGSCASAFAGSPLDAEAKGTRVLCLIRQGEESKVLATVQSLGLGGEHLGSTDCQLLHEGLAESLAAHSVCRVDSPIPWALQEPGHADEAGLQRFIAVESSASSELLLEQLSTHHDLFESVQEDAPGRVLGEGSPDDPLFHLQYALHNTGVALGGIPGVPGADIAALEAWQLAGGTSVTIAIVDTGVSHSHPDLAPKLVPGYNFIGSDPTATDDSSFIPHGTACAGIAAAAGDDGNGIAGVSWSGRIMPIRVADQWGNSSEFTCANGIIWAVDHGARVISISLGFTAGTDYLRAAVAYAVSSGAVVVAAAGNTPGTSVYFPARWPEVLCVTATDHRDVIGQFCTTGAEVDVCAPGIQILTTTDTAAQPNGHRYETGTSMAAPFVSGIAALLIETAPWLSSQEVRRIIRETADDRGEPGWDPSYGHGRVNAAEALHSLFGDDQVCPADWNADGLVSGTDFFAYLNAFFAGQADINGDGNTTTSDLFEFLTHYVAGC